MNIEEEFVIENGVLKKYLGTGGEVIFPDGITEIGDWTFLNCNALTEVTIPEGVTKIGSNAFLDCKNLKTVILPDSLRIIGLKAFCGCTSVSSLSIPGGLKVVGMRAFEAPGLVSLELRNNAKITKDMFGATFPAGLVPLLPNLAMAMEDPAFKQYVLTPSVWAKLDFNTKCGFLAKKAGKTLLPAYNALISTAETDEFGTYFISLLSEEPSAQDCSAAGAFLVNFSKKMSEGVFAKLQEAINSAKTGKKAAASVEKGLEKKKAEPPAIDPSYSETAKKLLGRYMDEKTSAPALISQWNKRLKEYCSLSFTELPSLSYKDGSLVEPFVFAWVLFENGGETEEADEHEMEAPWYSEETAGIIKTFDPVSFQAALIALADSNLGLPVNSKKLLLAFPICRFADEATMKELTNRAPKWRSHTSGINSPSLWTFRKANKYSNLRTAMLFADRYGDLYEYARLRGVDTDTIYDQYMSDFGLDQNGCKSYDLGNITVTARMLSDLSFVVELPDLKTSKSLPKKGADSAKYEAANKDFTEMKKDLKKVVKSRKDLLFQMFLDGRTIPADRWKLSYMNNPVLHKVAELMIWNQAGQTFMLSQTGTINSVGEAFEISDTERIGVAHPLEMEARDIEAWQRYFTSRSLKQPFEQIWEPKVDFTSVKSDRYKGCMIPYYRFINNEKHGIRVYDYDFHNSIDIQFDGCTADVERKDWMRHTISMYDEFEVKSFTVERESRIANHIIYYLDKCTVYGRILKEDMSIIAFLPEFTLAQISDFVKLSIENQKTNILAVLLDYKNSHFADFDPMDEFILE